MAIVNEIKCARCDRKYSGVRSRCPYCGARRIGRGKYSEGSDNAKGKMLISVLIMAVFTVGAGILLFSTPVDADGTPPIVSPAPTDDLEDGITEIPGPSPDPTEPPPTPTPVIQQQITSLNVTMAGSDRVLGGADNNFTLSRNEKLPIRARIEPLSLNFDDVKVEFSSSNEEVFTVTPVPGVGGAGIYGAEVTWVGNARTATLTVTAIYGDQTIPWTVRVHANR